MASLRFVLILMLVLAFVLIGLPLDALSKRLKWPLREQLPLLFHRILVYLLQIRVRTNGNIYAGPALLVANHVSWTDISVIGSLMPVCFVAKKDVASWPIFGFLAKAQGSVFVDRNRRMQVHNVNLDMAERLGESRAIVLFPEGTTGDGHRLLPFHTSHLAAAREVLRQNLNLENVAVQPVSIVYLRCNGMVMARNRRSGLAWYGNMTLLPHLWAILNGGPVDVMLSFGTPLHYRRGTNRKIFAGQIAAVIRQTNYSVFYGRGGEVRTQEIPDRIPPVVALPLLNDAKTP